MTSAALEAWRTSRSLRLDRLREAHAAFAGTGPGRRWRTDELNHSLVLRLASEFQGFVRDLHDETINVVVSQLASSDAGQQLVLRIPYTAARKLDQGNAEPGRLGYDFGLFGMRLWPELTARYPGRAGKWNKRLELLNKARNGLAHDDARKVAEVVAAGWPMTLRSVDRWRRALDGLAQGMDHVVSEHLRTLFGARPW